MIRSSFVSLLILVGCQSPAEPVDGFDPWVGSYKKGGQTVRIERIGERQYRLTDPPYRGFVFIANEGGWLEDRGGELGRILPSYEDTNADPPRPYKLLRVNFQALQFTLIRE
ncbi:MAG: hypothetical protein ACYS0E_09880 [Planctomycetota bacterium]|jgi:hypothetical protein